MDKNRTFFTTATPPDRGHLEAWQEEDVVYISVTDVVLKPTEFYTVSAKNEDAKVIFVADDVEPNKQFSFRLERPTDLFFALSIGSKTYAVMQIEHAPQPEPQPEHEYDFYSASWIWADNLESAVLRVPDLTAGGTVDMPAIIESSIHVQPTCTSEGGALYVATVTAQGHDYTDERTKPIAALGHDYGQPTFEWTPVYEDPTYAGAAEEPITQDDPTQTVLTYTAIATWVCSRNPNHTHAEEATVEAQPYTPATCTEDGYKTYTATATMAGVDYEAQRVDVFEGTAMGHTYDTQPTFEWTQLSNGGYTAVAVFVCSVDGYQMTMDADMSIEQHSWDDNICEGTGDATYTAMVLWGDELYSDSREASVNAIGHRFDEYYFNWDADADGVHGATLVLVCSINSEHTLELEAQLTVDSASPTCTEEGHIYYTATVVYDDHEYSDMYPVTLPALEHEYGEEPEWTWTPDGNGGYTATATWVCIHDSSHVQVVDAVVALNVNDNTDVCTEGGHVTYTATAEFGDNEYQTEYEVDVEPLGHDYSEEPEWDWQDDGNGNMMATAIFYCSRNPEHEMELEAEVTQEETNEGTLYTATVVYNSVEHSDTYLVG